MALGHRSDDTAVNGVPTADGSGNETGEWVDARGFGATGAGKTHTARLFGSRLGAHVIEEPVFPGLLRAFSDDPEHNCYPLQRAIIEHRAAAARDVSVGSLVVWDRTLAEDRDVFLELHYRRGYLSNEEHAALRTLSVDLEHGLPAPDAVVFVTAGRDVLLSRMEISSAPQNLKEDLDVQLRLYEHWRGSLIVPVVVFDTSRATDEAAGEVVDWVADTAARPILDESFDTGTQVLQWTLTSSSSSEQPE